MCETALNFKAEKLGILFFFLSALKLKVINCLRVVITFATVTDTEVVKPCAEQEEHLSHVDTNVDGNTFNKEQKWRSKKILNSMTTMCLCVGGMLRKHSAAAAEVSVHRLHLVLTDEQLAVELQVEVSVGWSLLRGDRKLVQSERRLLDVPLGSDSVPPVVVQRDARLHANLQRAVTHVEGENHLSGG